MSRFCLQMLEECEYRRIDLSNALHLNPVPTARKDGLAESGDKLLHLFDPSARTHYLHQSGVLVTPQEESGLGNAGSTIGSEEFPVAVDIAVPVEATAKSGAFKLGGINVEIRFGEPGW